MAIATEVEATRQAYDGLDVMPIAGEWRRGRSDRSAADTDPWSGEALTEINLANVADVDAAYKAAKETQPAWAAATPGERADVMRNAGDVMDARKNEIISWLVREAGSTIAKATWEWLYVRGLLYEAASMPHHVAGRIMPSDIPAKESRVYRQPVGVVAVISPWNYPWWLSSRSVAPALAVGNAVVLKPAGETPVTGGLLLAKVLEEGGLPPGVLNVLIGSGREIGDAIVEHPIPRVVSFTGSTEVGKAIPGKAPFKRLGLELGGNAPLVILDDADLDRALDAAVFGSFFHQGQICVRANRIVVDQLLYDEFLDGFVERAGSLRVGDPSDPDTQVGPIINRDQLQSIQDKVVRSQQQGGTLVLCGDPMGPTGLVLPPHIITGDNDLATAREEVFGPVSTVIRARDEEEALAIANDTEFGLSSAVFTRDAERGVQFSLRVQAGMTHVNDSPANDDANTAFGGEKQSGFGRFGGAWAIEEFTTDHWISVQREPRVYPI